MAFDKNFYKQEFEKLLKEGTIKKSNETFKIRLFLKKGENSLLIAKFHKDIQPTKDHYSAQIALGHLLIPNQIEKEDLELLQQSHKIFEDEYVKYFEDAKKEAQIARYTAIKTYTEKRLKEIYDNAQKFVAKIALILQE